MPSNTPQMLLQFCTDVAAGMVYLSSKAFVHRDLAARNILLTKGKTCKVREDMVQPTVTIYTDWSQCYYIYRLVTMLLYIQIGDYLTNFVNLQIGDFGLSRDLEDESYYISHGGEIPVKWTAPEVST